MVLFKLILVKGLACAAAVIFNIYLILLAPESFLSIKENSYRRNGYNDHKKNKYQRLMYHLAYI